MSSIIQIVQLSSRPTRVTSAPDGVQQLHQACVGWGERGASAKKPSAYTPPYVSRGPGVKGSWWWTGALLGLWGRGGSAEQSLDLEAIILCTQALFYM